MQEFNQVIYILWRDIPAQIIVGKGRQARKVKLPDRFEQAIDKCAMRLNLTNTDDYLSEWHKSDPISMEGSIDEVIASEEERLNKHFDNDKLRKLISNAGRE